MAIHSHRSLLFRLLWPVTQYFITSLSVTLSCIYFRLLNNTTVISNKETAQEVIDKVMEAIRALKIEIQKMKAQR